MAPKVDTIQCPYCGAPTTDWWTAEDGAVVPGAMCRRCYADGAFLMPEHELNRYLSMRANESAEAGPPPAPRSPLDDPRGTHQHGDHMRVQLGPTGQFPTRGHADDAGLDLYVSSSMMVPSGQFRDVPCDVGVALPVGTWGMLTGRSSTLRKHGLMVAQGVIDAGYRGPLYTGVWNLGPEAVEVQRGWRISQLIVIANVTESVNLERVDELTPSDRGNSGFGSTGV